MDFKYQTQVASHPSSHVLISTCFLYTIIQVHDITCLVALEILLVFLLGHTIDVVYISAFGIR